MELSTLDLELTLMGLRSIDLEKRLSLEKSIFNWDTGDWETLTRPIFRLEPLLLWPISSVQMGQCIKVLEWTSV